MINSTRSQRSPWRSASGCQKVGLICASFLFLFALCQPWDWGIESGNIWPRRRLSLNLRNRLSQLSAEWMDNAPSSRPNDGERDFKEAVTAVDGAGSNVEQAIWENNSQLISKGSHKDQNTVWDSVYTYVQKFTATSTVGGTLEVENAKTSGSKSIVSFESTNAEKSSSRKNDSKNTPGLGVIIPDEDWGYMEVRPEVNLFWLLYGHENSVERESRPLILWLQGSAGASSVGFGAYSEIGPKEIKLNSTSNSSEPELIELKRLESWTKHANLLFIDSPVGTGFSYTTDRKHLATTTTQIISDLLQFLRLFLNKYPDFKTIPLYIFTESYGGKVAAGLGYELLELGDKHELDINFKGIAFGHSWLSPIDYVDTWGSFLKAQSWVDDRDMTEIQQLQDQCRREIEIGSGRNATKTWKTIMRKIRELTYSDPFQYSRHWVPAGMTELTWMRSVENYINSTVRLHFDSKVGFEIPPHVTFTLTSDGIFDSLAEDFMVSAVNGQNSVNALLLDGRVYVIVYNGQMDLICNTLGTERWINHLQWTPLPIYNAEHRKPLREGGTGARELLGFVKHYENFVFYWIMGAGHMVATDAPKAAARMIEDILSWHSLK